MPASLTCVSLQYLASACCPPWIWGQEVQQISWWDSTSGSTDPMCSRIFAQAIVLFLLHSAIRLFALSSKEVSWIACPLCAIWLQLRWRGAMTDNLSLAELAQYTFGTWPSFLSLFPLYGKYSKREAARREKNRRHNACASHLQWLESHLRLSPFTCRQNSRRLDHPSTTADCDDWAWNYLHSHRLATSMLAFIFANDLHFSKELRGNCQINLPDKTLYI